MATVRARALQYFTPAEFRKGIPIKVAYVLLQQADMMMTSFAISAGFHEVNPIVRGILSSPGELLALKLFVPIVIAWFVPAKLLLPAIALLVLVLVLNLYQLSSML